MSPRYCKYRRPLSSLTAWLCFLSVLLAAGCERAAVTPPTSTEAIPTASPTPAPAQDAPLLLEDKAVPWADEGEGNNTSRGPGADNSRCFVCHANYMDEKLAVTHAKAKIGCADCHGPSDAHIADESWASGGNGTAPSIMYPREKINPSCMTCHAGEKIDTPGHQAVLTTLAQKVCTDCHGQHRLSLRRCKWK